MTEEYEEIIEETTEEIIEVDVSSTEVQLFVNAWLQYWMVGEQDPGYKPITEYLRNHTLDEVLEQVEASVRACREPNHPMSGLRGGIMIDHRILTFALSQAETMFSVMGGGEDL